MQVGIDGREYFLKRVKNLPLIRLLLDNNVVVQVNLLDQIGNYGHNKGVV